MITRVLLNLTSQEEYGCSYGLLRNFLTSPKMKSPSTPDELSIIDNSMLTRKKQQPSKIPTPVTTKTSNYKAKEVSRKHLFSDDLFLHEEIRKELDNKQQIIESLLQQILENVRPIHQTPILIMVLIWVLISNPQGTNPQNTNHHLN